MLKIKKTKQSPNFSLESDGTPKKHIKRVVTMHSTVGNFDGAMSWLCMTPEQREKMTGKKTWSSAHILDDRNDPGVIHQLIDFEKRAWHAGGVTQRTERAMKAIGVRDPNNECIGYEFVNYFDIDKDGKVADWEKAPTEHQLNDFVDFCLWLEEESKTNEWLDFIADDEHIITHRDTNHFKPDMELAREKALELIKQRKGTAEVIEHVCDVNSFSIDELIDALIKKIKK